MQIELRTIQHRHSIANIDIEGANNLGTGIEKQIDNNSISEIKCPKIITFFINNIIGYNYFI